MPHEPHIERRCEARRRPGPRREWEVEVPGALVLEVIDVSDHGLCCRIGTPVAPGRAGPLRVTQAAGPTRLTAHVVRCEVTRLTPDGVEFQVAWRLEHGWPTAASP